MAYFLATICEKVGTIKNFMINWKSSVLLGYWSHVDTANASMQMRKNKETTLFNLLIEMMDFSCHKLQKLVELMNGLVGILIESPTNCILKRKKEDLTLLVKGC